MSKVCLNCGAENHSKFCSECGQKTNLHRLTVSHIAHEIFHVFTHADAGILFLIKEMFIRPGTVVKEYVEGKRKKYFNPFSYLLITAAIGAFVIHKFNYYGNMNGPTANISTNEGSQMAEVMRESAMISQRFGKILSILFLPLLASISSLFYMRQKYNFAEHLTLFAFLFGHISIIYSGLVIFSSYAFPDHLFAFNMVYQFVFLFYLIVISKKVFEQDTWLIILKSIFIILLFIILFWILMILGIVIKNMII